MMCGEEGNIDEWKRKFGLDQAGNNDILKRKTTE
jgi:hypothetical protein